VLVLTRDEIPPGTLLPADPENPGAACRAAWIRDCQFDSAHSNDVLQVEEGSLYPALQRMLIKGWVTAKWGTTGNRRARYYKLTAVRRKQLALEISQFERVMEAIGRVIQTA
jgi:PadR family transcriptional regulator PadR